MEQIPLDEQLRNPQNHTKPYVLIGLVLQAAQVLHDTGDPLNIRFAEMYRDAQLLNSDPTLAALEIAQLLVNLPKHG